MKCSICGSKEVIGYKIFNSPRGAIGFVAYKSEARCKQHIND